VKHFELTGDARKHVLAIFEEWAAAKARIRKFVRKLGAREFCSSGFFRDTVFGFTYGPKKTPDPRLRQHYSRKIREHTCVWVPNRSTKEGRALATEMRQLKLPGAIDIAKIIGMSVMGPDLTMRLPGTCVLGPRKRVIVTVPDDVTVKGAKRISDVAFERLDAKYTLAEKQFNS